MDENPAPASRSFAGWWLGGFGCVGAVLAGGVAAVFSVGFLGSLGMAVLGAIVSLSVGIGLAKVVVPIADGLGWDERPETSPEGRLARRVDQVIKQVGL